MLAISGVLALGIFCQWAAWRLKLPAILPLLAAGFTVGPLLGWLHPQEILGDFFFPMVSLLVAIILFEGALTLEWGDVRHVASTVRNLMTVGAAVTLVGGAAAAHFILGLGWEIAILFGALIVVTGPTVIAPLLRNVRPTAKIASILRWEGILIDPLGALLAVLIFDFIVSEGAPGELRASALVGFLTIVAVGTGMGLLGGLVVAQMIKRYWVPDYLRDVVVLALVTLVFAASDAMQTESGLLAVTVMGIFLANSNLHQLREVWYFKEKLSVIFISVLFIILAANIGLDQLALLDWRSLVLLVVVLFVLRPVGIQLSALGSDLTRNERTFLSWIAPRGIVAAAVSSLFAFRLKEIGFPGAEVLEPLVFMVIVGTVVLQGLTAKPFARFLGVAEAEPQGFLIVSANRFAILLAEALTKAGFVVRMVDLNRRNVRLACMAGLEAHEGNILSEFVESELDMSGIGRMFALTSNDEANSLACLQLREEFGSPEVYQLPPKQADAGETQAQRPGTLGRLLFSQEATHDLILDMVEKGAVVKRTSITPQFTYSEFIQQSQGRFVPLLAYLDKNVIVATTDQSFIPAPGWTLVSLVLETTTQEE
ncbi:MAG: cation:proton antiporter [Caldilineaceae bacterium]|nr:cation:proton antiporter [Caldilineaceae bacterium]MBP8109087.1 cation:proton antiporter [Caldilineaceae bacterium]MBP8124163.1 cation:proton antiporter [Caldilineaceae bacterium]MBP9073319.1 cation:proton antiporter [Caldilineaceae bacterium]